MVVGPCPLCVPHLLYVSRMGILLSQVVEEQSEMFIILLSWSLFLCIKK